VCALSNLERIQTDDGNLVLVQHYIAGLDDVAHGAERAVFQHDCVRTMRGRVSEL